MIDLADGDLNENSYLEFSGYLNFDATTDGIIYQNAKKDEIDAIRAGNPGYDVFYEVSDPNDLLTDRKENEYFYQGMFTRNSLQTKVGCIFPMAISSEFRMKQNRDDDHPEDAPHFTFGTCTEFNLSSRIRKFGSR